MLKISITSLMFLLTLSYIWWHHRFLTFQLFKTYIKKMMITKIFLKMLWVIENEQVPEIKLYLVEINLLNKYNEINLPEISLFRWDQYKQFESYSKILKVCSILDIKGMGVIFKKEGKIFENLAKNVQNLKIFLKRGRKLHAVITCNKLLE